MRGYLLDTNHLSDAIQPGSRLPARLGEVMRRRMAVGVCVPVLCELAAGIQGLGHPEPYRQGLTRLLARTRIWPLDLRTAGTYGELFQDLRARGRALSQVDLMIAALARQMHLNILTADQDFAMLPDLAIENWLTP